ncbi:MAG: hypothetical protein LBR58_07125 [Propionibacteriaceae bacterium]|nr:hypothetical protein [Propionibacteriaceae bacterium]
MPELALGLDIGTSSVKASAITSAGQVFSATSGTYPSANPFPGAVEQNPADWVAACHEVLAKLLPELPEGPLTVGLTGQMHTSVLLDANQQVLRPAILWSDQRATTQSEALNQSVSGLADITGNPLLPAFTAAHLQWVREHEPEVFARIDKVLNPKDYIRLRLGAGYATEPADASGTALLDTRDDTWSSEMLAAVGLRVGQLPEVVPSHQVTGRASLCGRRDAAVIGGAGDQAAQAVALGVREAGQLGLSLGTSGVAFGVWPQPIHGAFRHCYDKSWLRLDSTHAAGLALTWLSELVGHPVSELTQAWVPPETAPVFLPYLQGHRSGPGAPSACVGLSVQHGYEHLAYAAMEGVAFELDRLAREIITELPEVVQLGGGGARSEKWRALLATALDRPVRFKDRDSSFGAAVLAAEAVGWHSEFESHDRTKADMVEPIPELRKIIAERKRYFAQLNEIL